MKWGFGYDVHGRLTSTVLDPSGPAPKTTTYTLDSIGQITAMTDTRGNTWTYTWDEARRLTKVADPTGDTWNYTYDLMGNVLTTNSKNSAGTSVFNSTAQFDVLGRLLKDLGAKNQITTYAHDKEDNLTTVTDTSNLVTTNAFDALNRIIQVTDRNNGLTLTPRNDSDLMTAFTDQRTITTAFTYDGFGEVLSEASPDRGTLTYTYNSRGLAASMTDGRGVVSTYAYDNAGRLTTRAFPSDPAENQSFTYDLTFAGASFGQGKIGRVNDESGLTETLWAANGSIKGQNRVIGGVIYATAQTVDEEGNLQTMTYPSGRQVRYIYNIASEAIRIETRVNSAAAWVIQVDQMTYLANGPLNKLRFADLYIENLTYDTSFRLTRIRDTKASNPTLRDVSLTYTTRDDIATITDALVPANNQTFTYQNRQFLASRTGPNGTFNWTYDAVGNRATQVLGGVTDAYAYPGSSNRLTSVSNAKHALGYDGSGNVISDTQGANAWTYVYNSANRMESVSKNAVNQGTYVYNAMGQKVRRVASGVTTNAIHDVQGRRIAEYNASGNALIREYVWLGDKPVAVVEGGTVFYIRADNINRPVFATNASGVKVWTASYLPFGGVATSTGTPITLRFPGQWFELESGLHQNWMRDYDPTTGRYVQADPLGLVDGASVFGYAGQSPMTNTDFSGMLSPERWPPRPNVTDIPSIGGSNLDNIGQIEILTIEPPGLMDRGPGSILAALGALAALSAVDTLVGNTVAQKEDECECTPANAKFWNSLTHYRLAIRQDGYGRKKTYYTWDYLHYCEVEKWDSRGNHLGSFNGDTGSPIIGKGPDPRKRNVDVR